MCDGSPNVDSSFCSNLGMASVSDFGSSIIRINTLLSPEERKKATVSIYLLNLQSPMLMLIRSAWNNYLIVSTQKLPQNNVLLCNYFFVSTQKLPKDNVL